MMNTTEQFTKAELVDVVNALLFYNVATRRGLDEGVNSQAEVDRIQALYEKAIDLRGDE